MHPVPLRQTRSEQHISQNAKYIQRRQNNAGDGQDSKQGIVMKEPTKIENSGTKLINPGNPTEAMPASMNPTAALGI